MKEIIKKLIVTVCIASMVALCTQPMEAEAATWKKETRVGSGYFKPNKAWEYTVTYILAATGTEIGTMTYGFDIDWWDEDYVWTKGTECDTLAEVQRINHDNDLQCGSIASRGKYSKVEVCHESDDVMYQIKFWATYGSINKEERTTCIKR